MQVSTFHYLFSFNLILFFNFTILYWFCHILKWIHHRYTRVPHSEPSSLLPPHTIPLGHPITPAPSIEYRASNLDWRFVPYMILYIFQCHSPKSSHPLPLPESKRLFYTSVSLLLCIISYMKWVTSPGSMHDTGCLGLGHWDDPEGWYGEGGESRFMLIYGKTNTIL